MAPRVELYQIYYAEEQVKHIYPFAIPYFNRELNEFFENACIAKLVAGSQADKIGVCSWALRDKLRFYLPPRRELSMEVLQSDYDVLFLTKNTQHHQMLARANSWHPNFLSILGELCRQIGLKLPLECKYPVYFNHFVADREVYEDYLEQALLPAMDAMRAPGVLRDMCWVDSGYEKLKKGIPMRVKAAWGFYPMHPFILERLFSCWIDNKKLKIEHL